jgi:hypothetical protein
VSFVRIASPFAHRVVPMHPPPAGRQRA